MLRQIDFAEAVATYVEAALPPFHQLRTVIAQLAGLLLLSSLRQSPQALDHVMLEPARQSFEEARAAILVLKPGGGGAHAHHHLLRAVGRVGEALRAIDEQRLLRAEAARAPLDLLQAANREIGHASRLLAPLNIVDLSHTCCAEHLGAATEQQGRA